MTEPNMKQMWQQAPDSHLDRNLQPIIEKWDDEPTAIQILELLDAVIHGGGGNAFVVGALETMLELALGEEKKTLKDILPLAAWRKQ